VNTTIPDIETMTLEQKLGLMEALWEDLSRRSQGLEPPAWHGDVLTAREVAVENDETEFESWDTAKAGIERDIR